MRRQNTYEEPSRREFLTGSLALLGLYGGLTVMRRIMEPVPRISGAIKLSDGEIIDVGHLTFGTEAKWFQGCINNQFGENRKEGVRREVMGQTSDGRVVYCIGDASPVVPYEHNPTSRITHWYITKEPFYLSPELDNAVELQFPVDVQQVEFKFYSAMTSGEHERMRNRVRYNANNAMNRRDGTK